MLNIPWVGMRCAPSGVLGAILLLATGCGLQHYQAAPLDQQQRVTANAVAQLDDRQLGASLVRLDAATRWPLSSWAPAQLALSAALRSAPVQEARAQLVTHRQNGISACPLNRHLGASPYMRRVALLFWSFLKNLLSMSMYPI